MRVSLDGVARWRPHTGWRRITTVDAHAAGEPLRLVTDGIDPIPGPTIVAKRRFAREHLDGLRRAIVFEPRGHADMYGAILTEPVTADADTGVLFMHNEGWSTMCGHGIIALATIIGELRLLPSPDRVAFDSPAGLVVARARREGGRVRTVAFENVPSFVVALHEHVDVPNLGTVRYDVAFGGAYYAFVDAASVGLALTPDRFRDLIAAGVAIKRAVAAAMPIRHPREQDLSFLYGTIFTGPPLQPGADSRNVCVFAEGEVDRSPTGTGVSGRVAIEMARGHLRVGEPFAVESIIGTRFVGRAVRELRWEGYAAVVPEVEGSAWVTGRHELLIAADDPLPEGFILR